MEIFKNRKLINLTFSKKAFSLLETIIYVAIFSIIVIAVVNFSNIITGTRVYNQVVFEVNGQGSSVIKTITHSIRNANSINSPTVGNTASNLSISTDNSETNPTVFSVSGGVLYITEGSGAPVAMTNNKVIISNMIFSNLTRSGTPDILSVSFNIASTSPNSTPVTYSADFTGSAAIRK